MNHIISFEKIKELKLQNETDYEVCSAAIKRAIESLEPHQHLPEIFDVISYLQSSLDSFDPFSE